MELSADLVEQWLRETEIRGSCDHQAQSSSSSSALHHVGVCDSISCVGADASTDSCAVVTADGDFTLRMMEEAQVDVVEDGGSETPSKGERMDPKVGEYRCTLDSEIPTSKYDFHITSVSVFKMQPSTTKLSTASSQPTKATATGRVSRTILVTAVTKTVVEPHCRTHLPLLVLHHLGEPHPQLIAPHKAATAAGGDPLLQAQQLYMSHFQDVGLLDINEVLPTTAAPAFAPESSSMLNVRVGVNMVGVVPLKEMACNMESGLMPAISQIVPLDCGNMLAVTCRTYPCKILDKLDYQPHTNLLLYQVTSEGKIDAKPLSTETICSSDLWICPVSHTSCTSFDDGGDSDDDGDGSGKSGGGNEPQKERILLASLSNSGGVRLYDCAGGVLEELGCAQCASPVEGEERTHEDFNHCVFCPTTCHLFVCTSSGKVLSLRVRGKMAEEHGRRRKRGEGMDTSDGSDSAIDWSLDEEDLDHLLSLVQTAPQGVPFVCSCPVDWMEISLEQVNRKSPLHVNPPPEQEVKGPATSSACFPPSSSPSSNKRRKNYDNSVILQYEPPLEPTLHSK